jgi:hypothetical protein
VTVIWILVALDSVVDHPEAEVTILLQDLKETPDTCITIRQKLFSTMVSSTILKVKTKPEELGDEEFKEDEKN